MEHEQALAEVGSNDQLGRKLTALIEAALWWYYCPLQGGYRHDGDRDGRSVEDTCEQLSEACAALSFFPRDSEPGAWMSEEDAESAIKPVLDRVAAFLPPNVEAQAPAEGASRP